MDQEAGECHDKFLGKGKHTLFFTLESSPMVSQQLS